MNKWQRITSVLLITIIVLCNTLPFSVHALSITEYEEQAKQGVALNLVSSLLEEGYELDFRNTQYINEQDFIDDIVGFLFDYVVPDDIVSIWATNSTWIHDTFNGAFDWLTTYDIVHNEIIPHSPSYSNFNRNFINYFNSDTPTVPPVAEVDDEIRTLATYIYNPLAYKSAYNVSDSFSFYDYFLVKNSDDSWYLDKTFAKFDVNCPVVLSSDSYKPVPNRVMLFYNTSLETITYYEWFNNTWTPLRNYYATSNYYNTSSHLNYSKYYWSPGTSRVYSSVRSTYDVLYSLGDGIMSEFYFNTDIKSYLNRIANHCNKIELFWGSDLAHALPVIGTAIPSSTSIIGGTVVTSPVEQPVGYKYPPDTYIDVEGLLRAILLAIHNKDVLTYSDIEDVIVDIDGQKAVAVYGIIRTDYDVMLGEQFPIVPVLDSNSESVVSFTSAVSDMAPLINDTYSILPRDLGLVLIGGGIVTIIAFMFKRMTD